MVEHEGGGGTAPAAAEREQVCALLYRRGRAARRLSAAGKRWSEPHFPAHESELAQAWRDGWQDMGDELLRAAQDAGGKDET